MIMKRFRNAIYKCPSPLPLMEIHPLLRFLSPPRERMRGEGRLSAERKKEEGDIGGMRDGRSRGLKGCYR
jgi:hypothetical protein